MLKHPGEANPVENRQAENSAQELARQPLVRYWHIKLTGYQLINLKYKYK